MMIIRTRANATLQHHSQAPCQPVWQQLPGCAFKNINIMIWLMMIKLRLLVIMIRLMVIMLRLLMIME